LVNPDNDRARRDVERGERGAKGVFRLNVVLTELCEHPGSARPSSMSTRYTSISNSSPARAFKWAARACTAWSMTAEAHEAATIGGT